MKTNINLSLMNSIESNDYDKVYNLVKNKEVDINYRTKKDETPLIVACKYGFNRISLLLISMSSKINDYDEKYKMSPLIYACNNNMVEVVNNIINHKLNNKSNLKRILEHKNIYGNNALLVSCYSCCNKIIPLLIEAGSDVNVFNNKGITPLLAILTYSSKFREEIITLLIEKGALVNLASKEGNTPLALAWYSNNNQKVIEILMEKGAIPSRDLMMHSGSDFFKKIRYLKQSGRLETLKE